MRILIILSTGLMGGVERHVQCLAKTILEQNESLHASVEVLIVGELGPIGEAMRQQAIAVHSFSCRNCHDWRIFPKMRQLLKKHRPDVVCMQGLLLFPTLYFKFFAPSVPLTRSIHTPTERESLPRHLLWSWLGRRFDWNLPVSSETWRNFLRVYPWAEGRGEVFFNPVRLIDFKQSDKRTNEQPNTFIVGMVGRMADQKDVPAFVDVCRLVRQSVPQAEFWVVGDGPLLAEMKERAVRADVPITWFGQRNDAKALIGQMDVFVMTSKHEQLPTTVLEAFGMRTAICGFIPDGGTTDVLAFSRGPVARVFQRDRSCEKLAKTVVEILSDETIRRELVEDGARILSDRFSAEKNVPCLVREILPKAIARKGQKIC